MRIKFLGVGEAFDETLPNTSIWVREGGGSAERTSILLDCGFTAPPRYWANCADPDDLDAIWISHFHGDHFFGIPALLTRFWESRREKPLLILGQEGVGEVVTRAMRLAYESILEKLGFDLDFLEISPGKQIEAAGFTWTAAVSGHPRKDLAVRLERDGKAIFYSGDGPGTEETLSICKGAGLAVHEAFTVEPSSPAHGNFRDAMAFAEKAGARALALVHVNRDERRNRGEEILRVMSSAGRVRVFMPEPGEEFDL